MAHNVAQPQQAPQVIASINRERRRRKFEDQLAPRSLLELADLIPGANRVGGFDASLLLNAASGRGMGVAWFTLDL
jgi:hypothetical protein